MSHTSFLSHIANYSQECCIYRLLEAQAVRDSNAIAIAAPGRTPLTYGRLCMHIANVVNTLNAMGLGRNECVAIVLPNGPEMAVAFIAVATCATSAPLNPAYQKNDTERKQIFSCPCRAGVSALCRFSSPNGSR